MQCINQEYRATEDKEQAIICLGNIAGKSTELRDFILNKSNMMASLIYQINLCMDHIFNSQQSSAGHSSLQSHSHHNHNHNSRKDSYWNLLEKIIWAISNLCRGKPKPHCDKVAIIIPILSLLMSLTVGSIHNNDIDVDIDIPSTSTSTSMCVDTSAVQMQTLVNVCWSMAYLTDDSDETMLNHFCQSQCQTSVFQSIQSIISIGHGHDHGHNHKNSMAFNNAPANPNLPNLHIAAFRILTNFVFGNGYKPNTSTVKYVHKFFHSKFLDIITTSALLTNSSTKDVRVEALFLLSNIAEEGGRICVDIMIHSPKFIHIIVDLLKGGEPRVIKIEALWIIGNIVHYLTEEELQVLVKQTGLIPLLCQTLEFYDVKTTLMVLDIIDNLLMAGERLGLGEDYRMMLDETDGVEMIASLQTHANDDVYRRSVEIIETYFGGNDEFDDEYDGSDHW